MKPVTVCACLALAILLCVGFQKIPGKVDWLKFDNLTGKVAKVDEIIARTIRIEDPIAGGKSCSIQIQARPEGAVICTSNMIGTERKLIINFDQGRPCIKLLDSKGVARAVLALGESEDAELVFFDKSGSEVGRVPKK